MRVRSKPNPAALSAEDFVPQAWSSPRQWLSHRSCWLALIAVALGGTLLRESPLLAVPSTSAPKASKVQPSASAPVATPPTQHQQGSGQVTIESDQQQADNVTGVITAIGNVRITYPDRGMVATARQAQYFTREGRLVLSGDVDVIDSDGQRLRADQIVYLLNGQRLLALPAKGQQVQTRLRFDARAGGTAPRPLLP